MFDSNILTFNPGWEQSAQNLAEFTDVRELQASLQNQGIELTTELTVQAMAREVSP